MLHSGACPFLSPSLGWGPLNVFGGGKVISGLRSLDSVYTGKSCALWSERTWHGYVGVCTAVCSCWFHLSSMQLCWRKPLFQNHLLMQCALYHCFLHCGMLLQDPGNYGGPRNEYQVKGLHFGADWRWTGATKLLEERSHIYLELQSLQN